MKKKLRQIGEQYLRYNLKKWIKKGNFGTLNDISENNTLVQLIDTLDNVNHAISIVVNWIFESNYEKALRLTRVSLNIICSSFIGEEQVVNFETLFYAVRYMWSTGNLNVG